MFILASLLVSLLENTLVLIKNTFNDGANPQRLAFMMLLDEVWSKNGYEWLSSDGKIFVPEWTKKIELLFALSNLEYAPHTSNTYFLWRGQKFGSDRPYVRVNFER